MQIDSFTPKSTRCFQNAPTFQKNISLKIDVISPITMIFHTVDLVALKWALVSCNEAISDYVFHNQLQQKMDKIL